MGSQAEDLGEALFKEAGQVRSLRNDLRNRTAQTGKLVRHFELLTQLQRAVMEFDQGQSGDPEMLGHLWGAETLG